MTQAAGAEPEAPATPAKPAAEPDPAAGWRQVFEDRCALVRQSAEDWGVRWHEPEGRFVGALLGAIGTLADLGQDAQGAVRQTLQEAKAAAQAELATARLLRDQAQTELLAARSVRAGLVAEHEALTLRMIREVFPMFADKLQGALVIRERAWNRRVEYQRMGIAGAGVLAVFLAGMALQAWYDWDRVDAYERCRAQSVVLDGKVFCVVPDLTAAPPAGRPRT